MCGICGIVSSENLQQEDFSLVSTMNDSMAHRGPDDSGQFRDDNVILAMRRLSIIDIAGGKQPLANEDNSIVLVANGEIYNYIELSDELKARGHQFRTGSDCETIVHLYEEFGVECLAKLRGMFAFALWDKKSRQLLIARDRIGEKPLYLWQQGSRLIFASELRTLTKALPNGLSLDPAGVDMYMHYQYVPEPMTVVKDVNKLQAGHFLLISPAPWQVISKRYWNIESVAAISHSNPPLRILQELQEVTSLTLRSDVPVGIALSGGMDSNAIAVLSKPKYFGDLHAFTVGYEGKPVCDETDKARLTAQELGLPFHQIKISTDDFVRSFPELVCCGDDPVADIAAYGYFSVMKEARKHNVPVMLTGFGGDELFWGYPWVVDAMIENTRRLSLFGNSPEGYGRLATELSFYERHYDFKTAEQMLPVLYTSNFRDNIPPQNSFKPFRIDEPYSSLPIRMCRALFDTWLVPNCIVLGDRLSMASSVELRLPLLDYKLVELVMGLRRIYTTDYHLGTKSWLKEAIKNILPERILNYPKRGFTPPVQQWSAGAVQNYGHLLKDGCLVESKIFDHDKLKQLLAQPINGGPALHFLYKLLILEIWSRSVLRSDISLLERRRCQRQNQYVADANKLSPICPEAREKMIIKTEHKADKADEFLLKHPKSQAERIENTTNGREQGSQKFKESSVILSGIHKINNRKTQVCSPEIPGLEKTDKCLKMQIIGTDYGGWAVDLDLIPFGSTIISAGVGEDISFDLGLINLKSCRVIGIDPTEKARRYIQNNKNEHFDFLQKALYSESNKKIRIYKNTNPDYVSESITPSHKSVSKADFYEAETISIEDLLNRYKNVSVLKMDIEGAEYKVLNSISKLDIPQICIEFHHFCTDFTTDDTKKCIKHLQSMGYVPAHSTSEFGAVKEATFVHQKYISKKVAETNTWEPETYVTKDIPVILVCYNRPKHTLEVLKALRAHNVQNLYIFSDAPKAGEDIEAVSSTRRLLHSIDWTKPKIIERTENFGLARSIVSAVDYVFQEYDKLILLEDDVVPQRYFFDFITTCLQKYENNPRIFGVVGHTVAIPDELLQIYPYDLYFCPRIGSWGWATWKRAWEYRGSDLLELIDTAIKKGVDLGQGGTDIPLSLENILRGEVQDVWTLHWVLSVYINNGVYIYPTRAHIHNIGIDGTGVHCGTTDRLNSSPCNIMPTRYPSDVFIDNRMIDNFKNYYDSPAQRVQNAIGYLNSLRENASLVTAAKPENNRPFCPANQKQKSISQNQPSPHPQQIRISPSEDTCSEICNIIRAYTKLSNQQLHSLANIAIRICQENVSGNFIQCSANAGSAVVMLAYIIKQYSAQPRWLYVFENPTSKPFSTESGTERYTASYEFTQQLCAKLDVTDIIKPVKGNPELILPKYKDYFGMVSLLNIEGTSYTLTKSILENLYDHISNNAVIQVDDYDSNQECKKAIKEFESTRAIRFNPNRIDQTAIWFHRSDKLPVNGSINADLIAEFEADLQKFKHIESQMSLNERFQLYYAVRKFLPQKSNPVRFIEIGSYAGASLAILYSAFNRLSVPIQGFSIEPAALPQLQEVLNHLHGEVHHLPMYSDQAVDSLKKLFEKDGNFPKLIFVDGDHTYQGVRNDILAYYPLLAKGGLMIFHDFLPTLNDENRQAIFFHHAGNEPGIRRACQETMEDMYSSEPVDVPLLYPTDPAQTQPHLPIIKDVFSTIKMYKKPVQPRNQITNLKPAQSEILKGTVLVTKASTSPVAEPAAKSRSLTVGYVSANDIKGGAQKVAWVLKQRVKQLGLPTKMFVGQKFSNDPDVKIITDAIQDSGTHYTDQGYMYYDVNSTFELVSQSEFRDCDVMHYHNLHGNYFNPFALPPLTKSKPSVWTLHDMHSMTGHCAYAFDCEKWQTGCGNCPHPEAYPPITKDRTAEMWRDKKLIYKESDFELIVPSRWLKNIVEKSILKDKTVHLIYNGIDERIYKPYDRFQARRKFNIPDNAIVFGFVAHGGLLDKRKGSDFILAAYQYFISKYNNVYFVCIGGKSNKAPTERFLQIPYVVDENLLAELYCAADVFMFPTLADNCPLIVLELMACGIPLVSFNIGGVPELIEHDRTGFIASYKNAEEFVRMVEHLALNKAKREQFSGASLERLQKMFTLDQMINKHIALYERLAEQGKKKNYVLPKNKVALPAAVSKKQNRYLVSAIISTYNSEKHIRGCLEDLEEQTIADKLEIIVVNSSSQQKEESIVKEFQQKYDNIKYIKTEKRETIYAAWNRAIKAASGKYITNANTDDRHRQDTLEIMARALDENPNKVLVYADFMEVKRVNGQTIPVRNHISEEFSRARLFQGECPPAYQPMWRKSVHDVFGYFDERFVISGDYEFWFRLTQQFDFLYLNEILGECFIGPEAVSQNNDALLNWENEMVIRKCYEYALQEAMTIGATGISEHPLFSNWPEVNIWKQNTKAKLEDRQMSLIQMSSVDNIKENWDFRTNPSPKLTIIIVTYNRHKELLENLYALNEQNEKDFEVIVMDNGGDLSWLKQHTDEFNFGLCGIELELNFGPSPARNIGTELAKAEYILFLDDDAVADKHLVRNIVEHFENYSICGLRGKVLLKTQTDLQSIPVNYDLGDQIITTACEVSCLSAFRKDVLVEMGSFDELLFGSEGTELSYRICKDQKEKVKSILYFPDVIVYHDYCPQGPARTEKILRQHWMALLAYRKDHDITGYRELVHSLYPGNKAVFENNYNNYTWILNVAIYLQRNFPEEAVEWAEKAVALIPGGVKGCYILGSLYTWSGRYDEALALLEKIYEPLRNSLISGGIEFISSEFEGQVDISECYTSVCTQMAQCYIQNMQYEKLKQVYTDLLNNPNLTLAEEQKADILNVLTKLDRTPPAPIIAEKKNNTVVFAKSEQDYLVSAIVSTYNSEKFLRGCLDGLEQQTIADKLEIIVINSGSQENEEAIIHEYQQKHNNIVYIKTEQREGIYTAWNRAIKVARGTFLTNANTDDRHREDALEIMSETLLTNPDVALVYGDQICTDTPNGTFADHHAIEIAKRPEYSQERLLFGCCVGSQPMWRKSLHAEPGYFDDTLTCAGDWDFWLRISSKYKFKHIPEFLGLYYYNENGIEHGRKIHSLYERYIVGKRYGNPYISVIPLYTSKDNPLVSVIMPAYNSAEHIAEAIESVLIQNYRNFELIVVDDGSTDDTKDIVASFKDDKIKYFYKENGGPSSARNLAIKKAKGRYIMPLDADDMMTPDSIAKHLAEFEKHPDVDLVYCDVLLIGENSNPIRIMNKPEYQDRRYLIRDLLRAGHPVVPFRLGIRRSVFDRIGFYDEDLLIAEDYDMMRRFVKTGLNAHHLSETLHLRRMHADSLSRGYSAQKAKCHFEVIKRFIDTFAYDELFPDVAWDQIAPQMRQLHAKCLAAGTYLAIGQEYVKTNAPEYSRTAFDRACSELNDCLKIDPENQGLRQLLQKSKLIRARYTEAPQQVVSK